MSINQASNVFHAVTAIAAASLVLTGGLRGLIAAAVVTVISLIAQAVEA